MNAKITEYISKTPQPQKKILVRLREIILNQYPNIKEQMKYGVPYFGEEFYLVNLKDHVNLGCSIKDLTKEQISKLKGTGKTVRHLPFYNLDDIDEDLIVQILEMVKSKH